MFSQRMCHEQSRSQFSKRLVSNHQYSWLILNLLTQNKLRVLINMMPTEINVEICVEHNPCEKCRSLPIWSDLKRCVRDPTSQRHQMPTKFSISLHLWGSYSCPFDNTMWTDVPKLWSNHCTEILFCEPTSTTISLVVASIRYAT